MNSLEQEYSFLAPTWKLPPVATSSIYSRNYATPYIPTNAGLGPDWPTWTNTMYNSRYISPYAHSAATARRAYPLSMNYPRSMATGIPGQPVGTQPVQPGSHQNPGDSLNQTVPSYYQSSTDPYAHPSANSNDGLNLTISLHPNNEYDMNPQNFPPKSNHVGNRGMTYATNNDQNHYQPPPPANQKRRVQIVDHNRQTPSTTVNDYAQSRNSRNSNATPSYSYQNRTPEPSQAQPKYRPPPPTNQASATNIPPGSSVSSHRRDPNDENKHPNNPNIHDYLYGLAQPDPGSYVSAYKNHQRRLQEEKLGRKSVMSEYKSFQQNGGFGPTFGNIDYHAYVDKDSEKKRRSYSKAVREQNHYKIEEQKRYQHYSGQPKNHQAPMPKSRRAREYAETIERPQHMRPVVRLRDPTSGNVIIRDAPSAYDPRISS